MDYEQTETEVQSLSLSDSVPGGLFISTAYIRSMQSTLYSGRELCTDEFHGSIHTREVFIYVCIYMSVLFVFSLLPKD